MAARWFSSSSSFKTCNMTVRERTDREHRPLHTIPGYELLSVVREGPERHLSSNLLPHRLASIGEP